MDKTFADGTRLISGEHFTAWAKGISALPKGRKVGCANCLHVDNPDYCKSEDCSMQWPDSSCSCHISPPCARCVSMAYEEDTSWKDKIKKEKK